MQTPMTCPMNDAFPRCAVLGSSCRLLQLEAQGPRPVWAVLDAARTRRFTGELTLGTSPRVVVWFDGGEAYVASRDGDAPIDEQLLAMGVISADDLAAGTVELGATRHLGRLFDRVPDLDRDRDRLELALELLTGDVLSEVADRVVDDVTVASYRHHPSGVVRWTKRPTVVVNQVTPFDEILHPPAEPATRPATRPAKVDVDAEIDETFLTDDSVRASEPILSWPTADFDVEMPPAPDPDEFTTVAVASKTDITSSRPFEDTDVAAAIPSTFDQPTIVWDIPTLPPVPADDESIGADTGLVMPAFDIGSILREVSEDGGSNDDDNNDDNDDDSLDITTVDEAVRAAVDAAVDAALPAGGLRRLIGGNRTP